MSATEPAADDPSGRLLVTLLSAVAQFDNEIRAERARMAMQAVMKRGGWVTHAPFGFKNARSGTLPILVEDLDRAPAVRDMFNGLAKSRRNVPQTLAYAKEHRLSGNACRAMLRNPVYAGFHKSASTEWKEVETAFPGLVPRSTWDSVQEILAGRKPKMGARRVDRDEFPLRGLIRCAECGRTLTSGWVKGRSRRYAYYVCHSGHVRISMDAMHTAWLDMLRREGPEFVELLTHLEHHIKAVLTERMDAGHDVWRKARDEMNRVDEKRKRLLDAFVAGAIPKADFLDRDTELATKRTSAEYALSQKETFAHDVDSAVLTAVKLFRDPVALWARLDLRDRRRFAMALYAGQIVLTKKGTVEPRSGAGLAGLLHSASTSDSGLAYLAGVEPATLRSVV